MWAFKLTKRERVLKLLTSILFVLPTVLQREHKKWLGEIPEVALEDNELEEMTSL